MITGKPFSDEEMDFFRKGGVFRQVTNTDVLDRPRWLATIDSLRAENARLREALEKIAKPGTKMRDTSGIIDRYEKGFYTAEQSAMVTARAALAPKEPQQ